jgi:hypothetical protein
MSTHLIQALVVNLHVAQLHGRLLGRVIRPELDLSNGCLRVVVPLGVELLTLGMPSGGGIQLRA